MAGRRSARSDPLERHEHRGWLAYPEAERDRLSKRNFYRFLKHWGDRRDLLLIQRPVASAACHAEGVTQVKHRVHVVPWLRRPAACCSRSGWRSPSAATSSLWRDLKPVELEHELAHVRQWRRHGAAFPLVYASASLRSALGGGGWYRGNRFEVEARQAAGQD